MTEASLLSGAGAQSRSPKGRWALVPEHGLVVGDNRDSLKGFLSDAILHVPVEECDVILHPTEFADQRCLEMVCALGLNPVTLWDRNRDSESADFIPTMLTKLSAYGPMIFEVPGTMFWYANQIGCETRVLESDASCGKEWEQVRSERLGVSFRPFLFWPSHQFSEEQIAIEAEKELGYRLVQSPEELAKTLGLTNPIKWGFAGLTYFASILRLQRKLRGAEGIYVPRIQRKDT